jgi:hypothetical protein
MAKATEPLRDIATLMLEMGLRPSEVFALRRENLHCGLIRRMCTSPEKDKERGERGSRDRTGIVRSERAFVSSERPMPVSSANWDRLRLE